MTIKVERTQTVRITFDGRALHEELTARARAASGLSHQVTFQVEIWPRALSPLGQLCDIVLTAHGPATEKDGES